MTPGALLRGFFALLIAGAAAWAVAANGDPELQLADGDAAARRRYEPLVFPMILPLLCLLLAVILLLRAGADMAGRLLGTFFILFLEIGLYDALLLPALPLLRRRIRARGCAALWLLPNFLYVTWNAALLPDRPSLVLPVPRQIFPVLLLVWGVGFAAVLLWRICGHLRFRRQLLRGAVPVTDPDTLSRWEAAQLAVGLKKPKLRLVRAPAAASPLSVGLFRPGVRAVLPDRTYTPEELELIFLHELVHIRRGDCWTKFFLTFCIAMCWFNPLLWLAMRRCAEDLELACDELVLDGADDVRRRRYAELLLRTAGDGRGFTTCLSASASALRYRLQAVLRPVSRRTGGVVAGALVFLLLLGAGHVSLAYKETDGPVLPDLREPGQTLHLYYQKSVGGASFYNCTDPAALLGYIESRELYTLTRLYSDSGDDGKSLTLTWSAPEGTVGLTLRTHSLSWTPLYDTDRGRIWYFFSEPTDWAYVESLLTRETDGA